MTQIKVKVISQQRIVTIETEQEVEVSVLKNTLEHITEIPVRRQKLLVNGRIAKAGVIKLTPKLTVALMGDKVQASDMEVHIDDIIAMIMSFLSINDVHSCRLTCQRWRDISAEATDRNPDRYMQTETQCYDLLLRKVAYKLPTDERYYWYTTPTQSLQSFLSWEYICAFTQRNTVLHCFEKPTGKRLWSTPLTAIYDETFIDGAIQPHASTSAHQMDADDEDDSDSDSEDDVDDDDDDDEQSTANKRGSVVGILVVNKRVIVQFRTHAVVLDGETGSKRDVFRMPHGTIFKTPLFRANKHIIALMENRQGTLLGLLDLNVKPVVSTQLSSKSVRVVQYLPGTEQLVLGCDTAGMLFDIRELKVVQSLPPWLVTQHSISSTGVVASLREIQNITTGRKYTISMHSTDLVLERQGHILGVLRWGQASAIDIANYRETNSKRKTDKGKNTKSTSATASSMPEVDQMQVGDDCQPQSPVVEAFDMFKRRTPTAPIALPTAKELPPYSALHLDALSVEPKYQYRNFKRYIIDVTETTQVWRTVLPIDSNSSQKQMVSYENYLVCVGSMVRDPEVDTHSARHQLFLCCFWGDDGLLLWRTRLSTQSQPRVMVVPSGLIFIMSGADSTRSLKNLQCHVFSLTTGHCFGSFAY